MIFANRGGSLYTYEAPGYAAWLKFEAGEKHHAIVDTAGTIIRLFSSFEDPIPDQRRPR